QRLYDSNAQHQQKLCCINADLDQRILPLQQSEMKKVGPLASRRQRSMQCISRAKLRVQPEKADRGKHKHQDQNKQHRARRRRYQTIMLMLWRRSWFLWFFLLALSSFVPFIGSLCVRMTISGVRLFVFGVQHRPQQEGACKL